MVKGRRVVLTITCPVVPDAVPIGTPIVHEAAGPVKWCWCSRCNAKVRESGLVDKK